MGSTLEHGIYLPSEGEKNCYSGLANNWQTVDTNIGYVTALRQAIAGALTRQIVTQLPTEDIDTNCIYMILKATAQTSNIYDEYMYINSDWELIGDSQLDLSNYYTKQEVNQLPAVASGVTSTKVGNYDAHIANGDIHVTASDKTKWTNSANTVVLRLAKTALTPSSSTNAFSNLDDATALKVGDKVMDTAGVLFEVTAIDTANSTFTIGTVLIDLAQDSDVVHKSGNETVSGVKSFSDNTYIKSLNFTNEVPSQSSSSSSIMAIITTITYGDGSPAVQARLNFRITADGTKSLSPHENNQYTLGLSSRRWSDFFSYHGSFAGQQQGDEYSGNARTNLTLLANRDTVGQSGCVVDTFRENTIQGTGSHILGIGMKENSIRYEGCRFSWFYDDENRGYVFALRPTTQGTNRPIKYELGTSTSKWTTVNGIEPSALGMPDLNNGIDISSYIDVSQTSEYTASSNGYISICGSASGTTNAIVIRDKNYNFAVSTRSMLVSSKQLSYITIPVLANHPYEIICGSVTTIDYAKFYPCLGNV